MYKQFEVNEHETIQLEAVAGEIRVQRYYNGEPSQGFAIPAGVAQSLFNTGAVMALRYGKQTSTPDDSLTILRAIEHLLHHLQPLEVRALAEIVICAMAVEKDGTEKLQDMQEYIETVEIAKEALQEHKPLWVDIHEDGSWEAKW